MPLFSWRRLALSSRNIDGVAAVEFAIIAPPLSLLLVGVIDLGMAIDAKMSVTSAAQAGTYHALLNGFDATAITNAVTNAGGPSGIVASPAPSQSCGCPSGTGV